MTLRTLVPAALCGLCLSPSTAAAEERAKVPEKYKWNLADLFPSQQAWKDAKEKFVLRVPSIERHRGHLGDSAPALAGALEEISAAQLELQRLYVYAGALSDEDTRQSGPLELRQTAQSLAVELSAKTSWVQPELLELEPAKVTRFVAQEKRLAPYRFFLDDLLRRRTHTRSAAEEEIAAEAGNLAGAGQSVSSILRDADFPAPNVVLSDGKEVRLDAQGYTRHRSSTIRADRDKVFATFFGALASLQGTFGATLYATVKADWFDAKVHKFPSTVESSLFPGAIPVAVYRQLVKDVHDSLPTLHRYLKLRQKMMGLSDLKYQDLYAPLVSQVELTYTPEQARALTLEAVAPLGKEYVDGLTAGFSNGWTDYLPTPGKHSGAYSTGVWGVHPYQLLNFNGKYEDLTTLAHESGHSMHTALANQTQPFPTADYPIFVAEVASTLNENLLLYRLLGETKDPATRLFLLGSHLELLRTTIFRQTLFAEFELETHTLVEKGESLTGERLTKLYLSLVRKYYGHDQGVCQVDDLLGIEWAYIPHFYMNFYVYQYATSLVASTSLARGIREEPAGETKKRDAYLNLLRSGGSNYPIELLKAAGVDVTTSAPFRAAMAEMNGTMDEIEKLLPLLPKAPAKAESAPAKGPAAKGKAAGKKK